MKLSSPKELIRFQLGGLLGEGADLQVFAAMDIESGEPVVVKRAHPSLVSRNMHRDVEVRTPLQAELRTRMGEVSGIVRFRMLTEPDSFAWYFGDDPGHPYSVQVEERAKGIPLVGGVSDMVRGHPVGLPLNLFILHPARSYISSGRENPIFTVLEVIESIYEMGYLAQDLGPQNVFYAPASGVSRVIDLGTVREPSKGTRRRPAFDLNDILFDIFRLYTTPEKPPTDARQLNQNGESGLSGMLERKAESLSRKFSATGAGRAEASLKILSTVRERSYVSPNQFRTDLQDYLAATESMGRDPAAEVAWYQAIQELRSPYWKKYLFDADRELRGLVCESWAIP